MSQSTGPITLLQWKSFLIMLPQKIKKMRENKNKTKLRIIATKVVLKIQWEWDKSIDKTWKYQKASYDKLSKKIIQFVEQEIKEYSLTHAWDEVNT